jgi:hypothetical protein
MLDLANNHITKTTDHYKPYHLNMHSTRSTRCFLMTLQMLHQMALAFSMYIRGLYQFPDKNGLGARAKLSIYLEAITYQSSSWSASSPTNCESEDAVLP